MTNLENAKNALDGVSYQIDVEIGSKTIKETVVPIASAFYALSLASETNWKYPEKNELPETLRDVLFVTTSNGYYVGYFETNWFNTRNHEGETVFNKNKIAAWCELPVFNKP